MGKLAVVFIKILLIIIVISGVYFIAAKMTNIDLPNQSVSLADDNGIITVDINRYVKSMDDVVLSAKRNDGTIIYNIKYNDIITNPSDIMQIMDLGGYGWLSELKYDNMIIYCKATNGRYIMADYKIGFYIMTLPYFEAQVYFSLTLIFLWTVTLLITKIRKKHSCTVIYKTEND